MKILIHSDNHWSEKASITTRFGTNYSQRLEMLINSMNWVMDQANKYNCEMIICAGDFFDRSNITQSEITALQEIHWLNSIPQYFLIGNHESDELDLQYSSTKALEAPNRFIISTPQNIVLDSAQIHFIPYITESYRQPIKDYLTNIDSSKKQIIVSHNDIAGINYGPVISTVGFTVDEIEANCDLYLNGHIHNSSWITKKILNLGSFSGHNFTNDSAKYRYGIWVLDTNTLKLEFVENPYAFNFYKLDINTESDINKLTKLKNNAVVSIKCAANLVGSVKATLSNLTNIIEHRIVVSKEFIAGETTEDITDLTVDQYVKFAECCREKLENTAILEEELSEILK